MTNVRGLMRLALLASALFGSAASALTYDELRDDLRERPSSWTATPSRLSEAERAAALAPSVGEESDGAALRAAFATSGAPTVRPDDGTVMPAQFDWRDSRGTDYMTSVGTQGGCGACVSFAAVSTIEAQLNIACGAPERDFELSTQYVHSCGGGNCRQGWKLSEAVDYLVANGVPDAACLPYGSGGGQDIQCSDACTDAKERAVGGLAFERPTTGVADVAAIKRALLSGPLLSNMILFEDLEYYEGGVYRHVSGRQLGSHAIVLVGWSDAGKAWIARNSWGEGWGDRGYFQIAWDDRTLPGRYTWLFDVTHARNSGVCSSQR